MNEPITESDLTDFAKQLERRVNLERDTQKLLVRELGFLLALGRSISELLATCFCKELMFKGTCGVCAYRESIRIRTEKPTSPSVPG